MCLYENPVYSIGIFNSDARVLSTKLVNNLAGIIIPVRLTHNIPFTQPIFSQNSYLYRSQSFLEKNE